MRLLFATLLALPLACGASDPTPPPGAPDPAASTETALTDLPVTLSPPYHPWADTYAGVRADEHLGPAVDAMIDALQAPGPAADRLRAASAAAQTRRVALADAGRQANFTWNGLDLVEYDLKICFFDALARAIAAAAAPAADRLAALQALTALVNQDPPVGLPAPNERVSWTMTGRMTAETMVAVQIEALGG